MSSEQFETLRKRVDSNQLIEDIDTMLDLGASVDDIKSMYAEFLNTEVTYDEAVNRQLEKIGEMLK